MSFFKYLRESAAEVKHISWPTSRQAGIYTILVIIISLFAAAYIGVFDKVFTTVVDYGLNGSNTPAEVVPTEETQEDLGFTVEAVVSDETTQ